MSTASSCNIQAFYGFYCSSKRWNRGFMRSLRKLCLKWNWPAKYKTIRFDNATRFCKIKLRKKYNFCFAFLWNVLGRVLEGISEFIFMLLLLLLAKGYTVTRGRLRVASAIKLTLFNCIYIVIYALLFLFEQYV